jgi:hypothetical protein
MIVVIYLPSNTSLFSTDLKFTQALKNLEKQYDSEQINTNLWICR